MKYRVGALVTGMIFDEFEVENKEQALNLMFQKHGDRQINLCVCCSQKVDGLVVSEDIDSYEIEEIKD